MGSAVAGDSNRGAEIGLQCVECGRVSRENERGWTARLPVDDDVAVYCPACDQREFALESRHG